MKVRRKYFIGDEWLYYKLYTSPTFQNRLLVNELFEIVVILYKENIIDKFFFVRYNDDYGPHLRLRFRIIKTKEIARIIHLFNDYFTIYVDQRIIHRISTDTYNREIERYGHSSIEYVETIFSINSWRVLHILKMNKDDSRKVMLDSIWLVDSLFADLDVSIEMRKDICEILFKYLSIKLDINGLKINIIMKNLQLNNLLIDSFLKGVRYDFDSNISIFITNKFYKKIVNQFKKNNKFCLLNISPNTALIGIIHMISNRSFSINQNLYELLLYKILNSYYKYRLATQDENKCKSIKP